MEHVSLTPEQLIVINKGVDRVIFYGGHTYMRAERDDITCSPACLVNSYGNVDHSVRFVWFSEMSRMSSERRLMLYGDNLYIFSPSTNETHQQVYDKETQCFGEAIDITPQQYFHATLYVEHPLPYINIRFGYITVKADKYDEDLIALVNKVIDQYNQLHSFVLRTQDDDDALNTPLWSISSLN